MIILKLKSGKILFLPKGVSVDDAPRESDAFMYVLNYDEYVKARFSREKDAGS